MMGLSAIVTGVFLFAYVRINTATASLAFACITGMLANFGKSYGAMSVKQWQFFDSTPGCRVCRHVHLYSRVFSWSPSRDRRAHCSGVATVWRAGCEFGFVVWRIHHGAYLCKCSVVDNGGGIVLCVVRLRLMEMLLSRLDHCMNSMDRRILLRKMTISQYKHRSKDTAPTPMLYGTRTKRKD